VLNLKINLKHAGTPFAAKQYRSDHKLTSLEYLLEFTYLS